LAKGDIALLSCSPGGTTRRDVCHLGSSILGKGRS